MKYHFKIHLDTDGYWTECLELEKAFPLEEAFSSMDELKENISNVLNLYLNKTINVENIIVLKKGEK